MTTWAYACRPCKGRAEWWVARELVDAMAPEVQILQVQAGGAWACAVVDRQRMQAVDGSLLRQALASSADECPDCLPVAAPKVELPEAEQDTTPAGQMQAAAVSLQGRRFLVVLTSLGVVASPGEADMLSADLSARFGGTEVVLMGQADDGTPHYHGNPMLLDLLADLPLDRLPWKAYPLR